MLTFMLTFASFILTILILVFVHEYGHYYIARKFKVRVNEFAIGFGPTIYSRIDKQGMKWKFGLIPIGGLVEMADGDSLSSDVASFKKEKNFAEQPAYVRFLIVAAGPIANYLLAILILSVFYFVSGKVELPAVIDKVVEGSPAAQVGLQRGDKVIKINGSKVRDFVDLQKEIILSSNNRPIMLTLERDKEILELSVTPVERDLKDGKQKMKAGYIGIAASGLKVSSMNLFACCLQAIIDVIDLSSFSLRAVGQMLTGERSVGEIYGFITIAEKSTLAIAKGGGDFALFIATISISLGLFNFLPIPLLDGGHLFLLGYEMITKRAISMKVQNFLHKVGMVLIFFLFVISTANDIKTLIF